MEKLPCLCAVVRGFCERQSYSAEVLCLRRNAGAWEGYPGHEQRMI